MIKQNITRFNKVKTVINESDIGDVFQSIYNTTISNMQKSLGKGSSWITDSGKDHNFDIWKYNPLAGSSYNKLLKELYHSKKV